MFGDKNHVCYLCQGQTEGLFLNEDLVALGRSALSLHKYQYVDGDSANLVDPTGDFGIEEALIAVAILAVIAVMAVTTQAPGHQQFLQLLAVRQKIADIARSYEKSENWLDHEGANKCNQFVYDVLTEAGHPPPLIGGLRGRLGLFAKYPPTAGQWATDYVDGWEPVAGGADAARPGDVIAEQINYSDASGHVGIVVDAPPNGRIASADSTADDPGTITLSDYGFRTQPVYRHGQWLTHGMKQNVAVQRYVGTLGVLGLQY